MNKILLKNILPLILLACSFSVNAQVILYENFDYTVPGYLGGNGAAGTSSNNWTTHNVSAGQTTTIDVLQSSLNYTGLLNSQGNKAYTFGNANLTSRDINRGFTSNTGNVMYYSALVKIVDNSPVTNTGGDYFMHFGATSGAAVTVFGGRLGVKMVNSGVNFRFLIQNTSSGTPTYTEWAEDLVFGNTYLVVVKYDRSVSPTVASLWVNPATLGGTEPSGAVTNSSGTGTFASFASICIRNNAATPKAEIDEIRVGQTYADVTPVDNLAPIAAFDPANNATGVATATLPKIYFDEPVRKTDGSELTNSDLASLVAFKKTNSSGEAVTFTATIDADKKIITLTPATALSESQVYYISVGAVEDKLGIESTLQSATFTTISAVTPTITVTYPNGGETMYSGEIKTITWTSTNFAPGELVKVEVWAPDETGTYTWITLDAGTANDGELNVTVGPNAEYGTAYVIRLTGVTNLATDSSNAAFTVIATATTLAGVRSHPAGAIVRYDGEAVITFVKPSAASRYQKYMQDATAGILIDDASAVITTTLNVGDKITGLEGQLGLYSGLIQIVPKKASVTVVSTGNTVTVPSMTMTEYLAAFATWESRLVKITNVWFQGADGTAQFAASTNYTLTDGTNTLQFRTFKADESNIIGTIIPVNHLDLTGLAGVFTTTPQILSRTVADFSDLTGIDKTREKGITIYPVPAVSELNIRNLPEVNGIEILDVTGKVVLRYNEDVLDEARINVSSLRKGIYFLKISTPTGKVVRRFVKS
ncbi:MAG: T9SS type A sorting domain-containing protein [Bacteroidales bacterium]